MTVKEALEEGYTLCGYSDKDYQALLSIGDITEAEMAPTLVLAEKEGFSPTINSETIGQIIAEHMENNWCEDTCDETEEVYKTVQNLDFTMAAARINRTFENKVYYRLTDIKLILDDTETTGTETIDPEETGSEG